MYTRWTNKTSNSLTLSRRGILVSKINTFLSVFLLWRQFAAWLTRRRYIFAVDFVMVFSNFVTMANRMGWHGSGFALCKRCGASELFQRSYTKVFDGIFQVLIYGFVFCVLLSHRFHLDNWKGWKTSKSWINSIAVCIGHRNGFRNNVVNFWISSYLHVNLIILMQLE